MIEKDNLLWNIFQRVASDAVQLEVPPVEGAVVICSKTGNLKLGKPPITSGGVPRLLTTTGVGPTISGTIDGANTLFSTTISSASVAFAIVFIDSLPDFVSTWSGFNLTTSSAPITSVRILYWV